MFRSNTAAASGASPISTRFNGPQRAPIDLFRMRSRPHSSYFSSGFVAALAEAGCSYPLLSAIASHADRETGVCWPSQARLAGQTGVGVRTIKAQLARLVAFRWRGEPVLLVQRRDKRKGNVYTVLPVDCSPGAREKTLIKRPPVEVMRGSPLPLVRGSKQPVELGSGEGFQSSPTEKAARPEDRPASCSASARKDPDPGQMALIPEKTPAPPPKQKKPRKRSMTQGLVGEHYAGLRRRFGPALPGPTWGRDLAMLKAELKALMALARSQMAKEGKTASDAEVEAMAVERLRLLWTEAQKDDWYGTLTDPNYRAFHAIWERVHYRYLRERRDGEWVG